MFYILYRKRVLPVNIRTSSTLFTFTFTTCDISTIIIHYLSQCNLIVISVYILFMMVPSGSQTIRNGSLPREIREWEKDIPTYIEVWN